jgi:hypothetical protein
MIDGLHFFVAVTCPIRRPGGRRNRSVPPP